MRRGLRERKPPRASASKKGAQDRQGETAVASMTHETNASDDVTTPPIGKQDKVAHHDYSQKKLQKWLEGGNITYAWTLLFAVSDNARLFVVAADGARVVLVFQPGEAVLFRGDVLHGGMAYSYRHWRAHFYLEPIGAPSLRHEDDGRKTFLALHSLEPPEKQREGMHARAVYSAESLNSAVVRCIAASVCG